MLMRFLEWHLTVAIVCLCLARRPMECKAASLVFPSLTNKLHTKVLVSITSYDNQSQGNSYLIDEIYSDLSSRVTVTKIDGGRILANDQSPQLSELQSQSTTTYITRTNHQHSVFKISPGAECQSRAIDNYVIDELTEPLSPFIFDKPDEHGAIIGPTQVIIFLQRHSDQFGPEVAQSTATVTHRGIVCREYLFTLRVERTTGSDLSPIMLIVSYFVPESLQLGSGDVPDAPVAISLSAATGIQRQMSVYFDFLVMKKSSVHSTSEAFLLPAGIGCSDISSLATSKNLIYGINESFMAKVTRQSFDYRVSDSRQLYKSTSTVAFNKAKQVASIRYDDCKTKVIVDLNSRLAHYIDTNEDTAAASNLTAFGLGNRCSAIQLDGYKSIKSMTLAEFLGLGQVALLGRASIEGHHECYVYESKLTGPALPLFFSPLREQKLSEPPYSSFSLYVVIYIAHRTMDNGGRQNNSGPAQTSPITTFPRRIEIYKRSSASRSLQSTLLERLDLSEFVWREQYSVETNEEMSLLKVDDCCNLQTIQRPTQVQIIAKFASDINTQLLINAAQRNIVDSFEALLLSRLSVPSPQITAVELQAKSGGQIHFEATIADYPSSQTRLIYIGNGAIVDGASSELEHLTLDREKYLTRDNCLLRASLNQNVQFVSYCYTSGGAGEQSAPQILCLALNTARISEKVGGPCEYYSVERTYRDFVDHGSSKMQLVHRLLEGGAETLKNAQITVELNQFKQASFVRNRAFATVASSIFFAPVEQHLILSSVCYKIISAIDRASLTGRYYQAKTAKTLRQCHLLCNSRLSCHSYSYCGSLVSDSSECILSDLALLPGSVEEAKLRQTLTKYLAPVVRRIVASVELDSSVYTFETNANCQLRQKDYTKLFSKSAGQTMLVANGNSPRRTSINSCAASCAMNATNCLKMAYCYKFQACYLEHQFAEANRNRFSSKSKQLIDDSSLVDDHCLIYDRKFASLYSLTRRKAIVDNGANSGSTEPNFGTVSLKLADTRPEICAKSCSSELGPKCLAFDHCKTRTKSKPDYCKFAIVASNGTGPGQQNLPLETNSDCDHYEKEQHTSLEWQDQSTEEDNGQNIEQLSVRTTQISYLITTLSCVTLATIAFIVTYRAFVVETYERFRQDSENFELSARG